jgi:hypothetical protein
LALSPAQITLLFVAGALLVPHPLRRARALVGTVAVGLALAAFELTGTATSASFVEINRGLLLLGVLLGLWSARLTLGGLVILIATGLLVRALLPLLRYPGWLTTVVTALIIGVSIGALGLLARVGRFAEPWRRLDLALLERRPPSLQPGIGSTADLVWFIGFCAAALAIVAAPGFRAVALAILIAGVTGHVLLRRSGAGSPIPFSLLLGLLIIPVFSYYRTISGDANPTIAELAMAPFSPAAEVRIFPWIAVVALGFSGLWPLHGMTYPFALPMSGVILLRLGVDVLPQGAEHWAPLFMPIILFGMWHAAATLDDHTVRLRRGLALLVGGTLFGSLSGVTGIAGAEWLVGSGFFYQLLARPLPSLARIPWGLGRLAWVAPAYGTWLVFRGGLQSQVTYTVGLALVLALAVWKAGKAVYILPR